MKILNTILLAPVRFYRKFISPLFPPSCRFTPTCSLYCIQAVEEWGPIRGFGLAVWRILRCNPWCRGGYDPVPENKKRRERLNKKIKNKER